MAADAATAPDPPGYFVGRPVHYQEQQQPQAVPSPSPEPAVDDHNAVNAQVPGYYTGRVQPRDDTEHNSSSSTTTTTTTTKPGMFAKWFSCLSGSSGNAN